MAHMKGAANWRNSASGGKQAFLPPKSPFPSIPPVYADYSSNHAPGSKGIPRQRDGHRQHQRTSSESFLIEEQPSWLEDLLNEPETPVRRGAHRRSSSDSSAYLDAYHLTSNMESPIPEEYNYRCLSPIPSWGCQDFEYRQDNQYASYFTDPKSCANVQNRGHGNGLTSGTFPSNSPAVWDKSAHLVSTGSTSEQEAIISVAPEKLEEESGRHEPKVSFEKKEASQVKHQQPEEDQKRVKQQFAQRSRVRKLQYIAELERNVQALQAEGSEVSAELQFVNQQNLILSLENKTLKQRLDSLAQEQLLKRLQQEMLEREIARLRALCQQQQQLPASMHNRSNSRDLDAQFANLSLKHKETNSGRDAIAGPLRI